jgi:hypothetical protein
MRICLEGSSLFLTQVLYAQNQINQLVLSHELNNGVTERVNKKASPLPSLKNWGGVRTVTQRVKRSQTLAENKEAVAYSLLCMANTKITDIVEWDDDLNIKIKPMEEIPDSAKQAIKTIRKNAKGEIEVELYDKVQVLRLMAKASGLLDSNQDEDKPSVIGINVKAPVEDVEEKK